MIGTALTEFDDRRLRGEDGQAGNATAGGVESQPGLIEILRIPRFPDNHFSTYHNRFSVLSRRDEELVEKYRAARNLHDDPYKTLVQAPSAHASEAAILRLFYWLWIILFTAGVLHLVWHLMHPDWRPA